MKKCFVIFLSALAFCFSLFWQPSVYADCIQVKSDQMMITTSGILINFKGILFFPTSLTYLENGVYEIVCEYYGSCFRCGYPIQENGRCANRLCNQYGPPQ